MTHKIKARLEWVKLYKKTEMPVWFAVAAASPDLRWENDGDAFKLAGKTVRLI